MASSFRTLLKILALEQQKGCQNNAVIGGFSRFAYHWARETRSQAGSEQIGEVIESITEALRQYETLSVEERFAALESIIALASEQVSSDEMEPSERARRAPRERKTAAPRALPARHAPATTRVERENGDDEEAEGLGEGLAVDDYEFLDPILDDEVKAEPPSVRERRGYSHYQPQVAAPQELQQLLQPVTALSGVGEKRAEQLARLGIEKIRDVLFFFPFRYDDYSKLKIIQDLMLGEIVSVIGMLERIELIEVKGNKSTRIKTRLEAYLRDESGALRVNWFNQPWIKDQLQEGMPVVLRGKIDQYLGRLVMNSPEFEALDVDMLAGGRVIPVYPLTNGLTAGVMRNMVEPVVKQWARRLPDPLPLGLRERADLMEYGDAVQQAHFPDTSHDKDSALFRLAFDELFVLHLAMLHRRREWQSESAISLPIDDEWIKEFEVWNGFPFTSAQRRAIDDIRHDLARGVPMNRLLQGDVGSGKTAVAAAALGIAAANGTQGVIMAPTSILAEQHFARLSTLFADRFRVGLLTGNLASAQRDETYSGIASGEIQIVVGTHALIERGVDFNDLSVAVIDEQHRFGVMQRGALRDKARGGNPHLLVMTATPIPRTLSLTVHADLDLTIIDEMPPGRTPVTTRVLQPKERERAYSFIRTQVEKGHQAYIIYPLVEDSEKIDARSAVTEHERLQKSVFPDLKLGLLHGRFKGEDKDAVMQQFYERALDVLVSTSVIEVGIDVPNATVILVENANRFGLAQLHQLRGRVGRGEHESYCLLVSDKAFVDFDSDPRLRALEETTDGFKLAQIDWEMRGPGDILGTIQSGRGLFRFADLLDIELIDLVQREARSLFESDPDLQRPEHQALARRIAEFTEQLGDVS